MLLDVQEYILTRLVEGAPMIQKCKHPTVISIRSGLVVMGETFNGIVE